MLFPPFPRRFLATLESLDCLVWENNINETWNNTWHKHHIFKNLLNFCTRCFRVKSTCSTSSLTIIYSHFLISLRQLPGGKTDTNISCKPPWKRFECRILDSITSSQSWKTKNINISTLQSVKLLNYLYGNEFEGCNISRISQICPKFAKFCTRNVTLV